MAITSRILLLVFIWCSAMFNCQAQSLADVAKSINQVKRDTMFIYAETTMKDLTEAFNGARALLEMKVGEWVSGQYPKEGVELCIVKAKEHLVQLETRRGDLYRAFVYVRKSDILPVVDKKEVAVFEVRPVVKQTPKEVVEIISEDASVPLKPSVELTAIEKEMVQISSFYDIQPYINGMKAKGQIKNFGKYATLPANEDCYLFVYDRQGKISALIRKNGESQYNLSTLKEDNVKNYKNCGAIWFQLK